MGTRIRTLPLLLGSLLLGIVCFGFVLAASSGKDSIYKFLNVFAEVYSLVRTNYVDPVDEDGLLDGAYKGMVGGLDLFSGYLDKEAFQRLRTDPSGGPADTGLEVLRIPGSAVVVAVRPDSMAAKAGLRPSDQIWSIEGVPTRQMSLLQVQRLQKGPEDSIVRLLVYHPKTNKREDLRIRRTFSSSPAFESRLLDGRVGYLRVIDMKRAAREPLRVALVSLRQKGASRLLLDLRGSSKGDIEDAVRVAGLFVPAGPVVTVEERGGEQGPKQTLKETRTTAVWTLPMFVLGNSGSAGAAEILTAALRARIKAPLFGETTYGLGSTQELVPLPSGDGLVISSAKLLAPGGESWNKTGLKPDTEIASTLEERAGLEPDAQLQKTLDLIRPPASKAA